MGRVLFLCVISDGNVALSFRCRCAMYPAHIRTQIPTGLALALLWLAPSSCFYVDVRSVSARLIGLRAAFACWVYLVSGLVTGAER